MRVLVACEFSGIVRKAFNARAGIYAMSCDLLPAEDGRSGYHYQGDVRDILGDGWDLMIAHPPCTYLARSGMRWLRDQPPLKSGKPVGAERRKLLVESIKFFQLLWNAPISRIAIENPRSYLIPIPHNQAIQPWQFGHGEVKETCLWLKNLPELQPTNIVEGRVARVHQMSPGPDRWRERSRTFTGIAEAMAEQWGKLPTWNTNAATKGMIMTTQKTFEKFVNDESERRTELYGAFDNQIQIEPREDWTDDERAENPAAIYRVNDFLGGWDYFTGNETEAEIEAAANSRFMAEDE